MNVIRSIIESFRLIRPAAPAKTPEQLRRESRDFIARCMKNAGLPYHRTDAEALRSDWQAVFRDSNK